MCDISASTSTSACRVNVLRRTHTRNFLVAKKEAEKKLKKNQQEMQSCKGDNIVIKTPSKSKPRADARPISRVEGKLPQWQGHDQNQKSETESLAASMCWPHFRCMS